MSYKQVTVSGLEDGETAYQFTTDPCKGEKVAVKAETEPRFDAEDHLVAVAVVATGRWIDSSGAAKTFPGGQPVKCRLPRTCHDAPDTGAVLSFFLDGDAGATPVAIPSPMRGAIQLAKAAGVT